MSMARVLYEGREYRDKVTDLDTSRKIAHDAAISACNGINRLCDLYKVEHLCLDDTSDRIKVADFIGAFVYSVYSDGVRVKTMDEAVSQMEKGNFPKTRRFGEEYER